MTLADLLITGKQLLAKHGLNDWTIIPHNGAIGMCYSRRKLITITERALARSDEEIINVLLHEIAHALCWEQFRVDCGHNDIFYGMCIKVGATPTRNQNWSVKKKWTCHCNKCGRNQYDRDRRVDLTGCCCKYCKSADIEWWHND